MNGAVWSGHTTVDECYDGRRRANPQEQRQVRPVRVAAHDVLAMQAGAQGLASVVRAGDLSQENRPRRQPKARAIE
jgi:hypothetical protein